MKCEKCASELPGSAVICQACGFNNAAPRPDKRKLPEPAPPLSPIAARVRARFAPEANLIPFPVTPNPEPEPANDAPPSWREQTKARVREHLEKRRGEAQPVTPPPAVAVETADHTQQLIVESALKRIRRVPTPQTVTPLPRANRAFARGNGQAQTLAQALELPEPEPAQPLSEPESQPDEQPVLPANSFLATAQAVLDKDDLQAAGKAEPVRRSETERVQTTITPLIAHVLEHEGETAENAVRKPLIWVGKPAPLWQRSLAGAVDLEAAALAYLPFFAAYTSLDGPPEAADFWVMATIFALVVFLYQLITYSFNGRTFGMAICGLRCVDVAEASSAIPFRRRLRQALGGAIGLLCPPFNLLVTRLTSYQRGLADALAHTITLRRVRE